MIYSLHAFCGLPKHSSKLECGIVQKCNKNYELAAVFYSGILTGDLNVKMVNGL
jgi:hypothetical protein